MPIIDPLTKMRTVWMENRGSLRILSRCLVWYVVVAYETWPVNSWDAARTSFPPSKSNNPIRRLCYKTFLKKLFGLPWSLCHNFPLVSPGVHTTTLCQWIKWVRQKTTIFLKAQGRSPGLSQSVDVLSFALHYSPECIHFEWLWSYRLWL